MRIALDPWGSDYASQFAVPSEVDDDLSVQALEERIEERPWAPVPRRAVPLPAMTAVVDGVMRSDASAMVMEGDRRALALFGCYATGAVVINSRVEVVQQGVVRLFIAGGNWSEPQNIYVSANDTASLCYQGQSSQADTYDSLREDLMKAMRQSEARVAESLPAEDSLILADGNLTFNRDSSSVVGVIKTIHRMYLSAKKAAILERLCPGERTPLFRIVGGRKGDAYNVFTCYLRLSQPQLIELPFAGVVRLEVKEKLGPQRAVALLEQAAVQVCALASRAPKDPRAPQNLIPVGGLERHLRHRLGDAQLVLRRIKNTLRMML